MNIFRLLADLLHAAAVAQLAWKLYRTSNATGLSLKSQIIYLIVFCLRYSDIFWNRISIYNVIFKLYFTIVTALTVWLIVGRAAETYAAKHDVVRTIYLLIPTFALSFAFTRTYTVWRVVWTWSVLLESVAMLPQLVMMWLDKGGAVDGVNSTYIILMSLYRFLYMVNWVWRTTHESVKFPVVLWVSAILQSLFYADFVFFWVRAKIRGEKLSLDRVPGATPTLTIGRFKVPVKTPKKSVD